jgi:hypothetical protein
LLTVPSIVITAEGGEVASLLEPLVSGIGAKGCLSFLSKELESTGLGLRSVMMLIFLAYALGTEKNCAGKKTWRNHFLALATLNVDVL